MKVIEISASVKEHQSKCVSVFLEKWFAGQIKGPNVPYKMAQKNAQTPHLIPKKWQAQKKVDMEVIVQAVREGHLFVNEKRVPHLPFFLKGKTKILIALTHEQIQVSPPSFKIQNSDILYEDNELVAINKPSGLASQSSFFLFEDHCKALLYAYYIKKQKGLKAPYLSLCHRLDKDTSGVLLLAKKKSINKGISEAFSGRQVQKTYLALVRQKKEGDALLKNSQSKNNPPLQENQKFTVTGFIQKTPTPKHPFYFSMHPSEGRYSETKFEVLKSDENFALLKCFPITGRSHQIRVHLKSVGLPILGDVFYNPNSVKDFSRLALHSHSLAFTQPLSQKKIEIVAPVPEGFRI